MRKSILGADFRRCPALSILPGKLRQKRVGMPTGVSQPLHYLTFYMRGVFTNIIVVMMPRLIKLLNCCGYHYHHHPPNHSSFFVVALLTSKVALFYAKCP